MRVHEREDIRVVNQKFKVPLLYENQKKRQSISLCGWLLCGGNSIGALSGQKTEFGYLELTLLDINKSILVVKK